MGACVRGRRSRARQGTATPRGGTPGSQRTTLVAAVTPGTSATAQASQGPRLHHAPSRRTARSSGHAAPPGTSGRRRSSTAGHVGPATQQHRRAAPPATQQHRRTAPPATQHGRARRAARGKASGPGARLARAGRTARLRDAAPKDDAGTHRSRVRAKAGREGAGVGSNERSAEICCCAEHIRPSARPSSGVRVIPRSTAGQAGTQAAGSSTSACSTSRAPPVIAGYLPARATLTSTAAQGSVMTRRSS